MSTSAFVQKIVFIPLCLQNNNRFQIKLANAYSLSEEQASYKKENMEQDQDQNLYINPEKITCVSGEDGILGCNKVVTTLAGFCDNNECVAVKCWKVPRGRIWKGFVEKTMMKEIKHIAKLSHSNILKAMGWTSFSNFVAIVTEFLSPGNLRFLVFNQEINLSLNLRSRFCRDISCGLTFLHGSYSSDGVALGHGSLRPDNILLDGNLRCKIADCAIEKIISISGTASLCQNQEEIKLATLDLAYISPERLLDISKHTSCKDDVYSFAIIMRDILTRSPVLSSIAHLPLYIQMIKDGKRPNLDKIHTMTKTFEDHRDKAVLFLLENEIQNCWKQNPIGRPDMSEVYDRIMHVASVLEFEELNKETEETIHSMELEILPVQQSRCVPIISYFSAESEAQRQNKSYLQRHIRPPPSGASSSDESTESSGTTEVKQLHSNNDSSPAGDNQRNETLTSQQEDERLLQRIQETKNLLNNNFVTEAVALSSKLTSIKSCNLNEDAQAVLSSVYSLTEQFFHHFEVATILSLLQWALKFCKELPSGNDSVRMKRKFVEIMFNVVRIVGHKDVENVAIPLLYEVLENLQQYPATSEDDKRYSTQVEARCLCCIAHAKNVIGAYQQAIHICRGVETMLITVFKDEAKKAEVFALCFSVAADSYFAMERRTEGESYLHQAFKLFKSAEQFAAHENTSLSN